MSLCPRSTSSSFGDDVWTGRWRRVARSRTDRARRFVSIGGDFALPPEARRRLGVRLARRLGRCCGRLRRSAAKPEVLCVVARVQRCWLAAFEGPGASVRCACRRPRARQGSRPCGCPRCRSARRLSGRRHHTDTACGPGRCHRSEGRRDHDWNGARHTDRGSTGAGALLAGVRGCDDRTSRNRLSRSGRDRRCALPRVWSWPARIPGRLSLPARPVRSDHRAG